MIIYVESPIESIKNLLKLKSEFSKLYSRTQDQYIWINFISICYQWITRIFKKHKILNINTSKSICQKYTENYKMLLREIRDLNKWRDIACLYIERPNINISTLPKLIYRFSMVLIKISVNHFVEIYQLVLKFIW